MIQWISYQETNILLVDSRTTAVLAEGSKLSPEYFRDMQKLWKGEGEEDASHVYNIGGALLTWIFFSPNIHILMKMHFNRIY